MYQAAEFVVVWTSQLPVRKQSNRALLRRDNCTRKPAPPVANKLLTISCYRRVCGRVSSVLCMQVAIRALVYQFGFVARATRRHSTAFRDRTATDMLTQLENTSGVPCQPLLPFA
jgi:hypothetical protein